MDISEERIRGSETYDNKRISIRKNFFEIFNENNTMNVVTETTIVCGNSTISDPTSIINCKKDENDNKEFPILMVNVHKAFDFMEAKGLQAKPIETTGIIYQLGQ